MAELYLANNKLTRAADQILKVLQKKKMCPGQLQVPPPLAALCLFKGESGS
jgi:hypothetical protein